MIAVLLSAAAFFTHKSCLMCLIRIWGYWVYLRNTKPKEHYKSLNPLLFALAMIILYFSKKAFLDAYLIPALTWLDDDHYMNYARDFDEFAGQMNFLPILYNTIMVSVMSWYLRFVNHRERYLVIIAIIGVFVDTLVFATGSIQRVLLYFLFANLAIMPGIVKAIEEKYGKPVAWAFMFLLLGYALKTSLPSITSTLNDKFGNYEFIFMQ